MQKLPENFVSRAAIWVISRKIVPWVRISLRGASPRIVVPSCFSRPLPLEWLWAEEPSSAHFYMRTEPVDGGKPATLVVADCSNIDCQLLADAVGQNPGFQVVDHATGSEELVAKVCTHRPDLLLVSAQLREGATAGLDALRKLRALRIYCRPVVLLDDDQFELVVEAFRSGARGVFCRNDGTPTELVKCAQCVHHGQIWVSQRGLEHLVEALAQAQPTRIRKPEVTGSLSKRELEVSRLVGAGLSNREISETLGLSEHTVKNYLFRIFEKVGVSTRTELVLHTLSNAKPAEPEKSILRRAG